MYIDSGLGDIRGECLLFLPKRTLEDVLGGPSSLVLPLLGYLLLLKYKLESLFGEEGTMLEVHSHRAPIHRLSRCH